ncbi:hypothetical protein [Maridesulfovibrio sp. FT414]|uniref:hypothetical protein n=1 Tax=Maridesulfovibrio sp. FT414 TaxID=2979469 RepID=UPI003D80388B
MPVDCFNVASSLIKKIPLIMKSWEQGVKVYEFRNAGYSDSVDSVLNKMRLEFKSPSLLAGLKRKINILIFFPEGLEYYTDFFDVICSDDSEIHKDLSKLFEGTICHGSFDECIKNVNYSKLYDSLYSRFGELEEQKFYAQLERFVGYFCFRFMSRASGGEQVIITLLGEMYSGIQGIVAKLEDLESITDNLVLKPEADSNIEHICFEELLKSLAFCCALNVIANKAVQNIIKYIHDENDGDAVMDINSFTEMYIRNKSVVSICDDFSRACYTLFDVNDLEDRDLPDVLSFIWYVLVSKEFSLGMSSDYKVHVGGLSYMYLCNFKDEVYELDALISSVTKKQFRGGKGRKYYSISEGLESGFRNKDDKTTRTKVLNILCKSSRDEGQLTEPDESLLDDIEDVRARHELLMSFGDYDFAVFKDLDQNSNVVSDLNKFFPLLQFVLYDQSNKAVCIRNAEELRRKIAVLRQFFE